MKYIFNLILLLGFVVPTLAQNAIERSFDIPVLHEGADLSNAWVGGLYNPQFYPVDVDFDGDEDLFVFDNQGDINLCFENIGETKPYIYSKEFSALFPKFENWVQLTDYNCDGIMDVFSYEKTMGSVRRYSGFLDNNGLIQFSKEEDFLYTVVEGVNTLFQVNTFDRPTFEDIDFDGDLDLLVFNAYDQIDFHQNQSMDIYGDCSTLLFNKVSDCWGRFEENALSNEITLDTDCSMNIQTNSTNHNVHVGLTRLLFYDYEMDDDMDLLYAYIDRYRLNFMTNGGNADDAFMTSADTLFPINDIQIDLPDYPAPYLLDIDNDQQKELLISPSVEGRGKNNCWIYSNEGTPALPLWERKNTDFLQEQMINVGAYSHPTLLDYNNDGLQDLVIANRGNILGINEFEASLTLYENIGSEELPSFELKQEDWLGLSQMRLRNIKATFGDLDADGDLDMVVGEFKGKLYFFENTADTGIPMDFDIANALPMDIDVGDLATPQLSDVDQDGDLDILTGEVQGRIFYYENIGTPELYNFELKDDFFGGILVRPTGELFGFSTPFLTSFDEDNARVLLVGNIAGEVFAYRGIDEQLVEFEAIVPELGLLNVGANASPCLLPTATEKQYLLLGTVRGGLEAYSFTKDLFFPTSTTNLWTKKIDFQVFPNPNTKGEIYLDLGTNESHFTNGNIRIYNSLGQLLNEQKLDVDFQKSINLSSVLNYSGLYFIQLKSADGQRGGTNSFVYLGRD